MNRYQFLLPIALAALCASNPASAVYWNLFNIEEENQQNSVYITYDTLADMLNDTNRTGSFVPDTVGNSAENVVGSGAFVMSLNPVPAPGAIVLFVSALSIFGWFANMAGCRNRHSG